MEFRILGPLEVLDEGHVLELGPAKQRALLATLLQSPNRAVSKDQLIEALWGERAPPTAQKALQVYVSQLRKTLGKDRILTRTPGYELRVEPGELDVHRFEALATEGRFEEALGVWRGAALADFTYEPFAQPEIARLEELRLACIEQRLDAGLADGRHASLVGELEALVREHPLRERLRGQLMLALYRSGRQAEALEVYQTGRRLLSDELGLEPSLELKELQRAILAQEVPLGAAREAPPATTGASEAPPASAERIDATREVRKAITVLSCDIAPTHGRRDPESLRHMTARGFDDLVPVLERHGGTVERSLGGVVTAIFGIPSVHEDDALRAARAAIEVRARLAALADELESRWGDALRIRVGIATGEVVTGGARGQPYATGEPVQHALLLQQAARPNEILLDDLTYRLVRDDVEADLAGEHPSLLDARAGGHASRVDSPMVGRGRERRRLRDAYEQAVGDRTCQLFTVLGTPGVGKSRLVQEFVEEIAEEALVARGRCLPYGEGITYWPVLEAVRDAADLGDPDSSEAGLARLVELLEGEEDAGLVAERLGEVIGLTPHSSGTEETFSALRAFFEALARQRPFVLVFDDVHWAEPTFLDLVDHITDWIRDAPILVVCVARPELLDARPHWSGGKLNATTVLLEPLSDAESSELVDNLVGSNELAPGDRQHIVETAGGNPLFVEEMVALVIEEGSNGTIEVPPTIQALLAARLDRLRDSERAAIEAASTEGQVFHEAAVAELVADTASTRSSLLELVRKELIRPDRPLFSGERAFRFRHLLIRDASYESIPKEKRALLHEHYAAWLEGKAGERVLEFEEILGYHLEQAFRYRTELGPPDGATRELAVRAGRRLGFAGRRALARGDTSAALNLTSRAAALLPVDDPLRVHVVPGVRIAQGLGDTLGWAETVVSEAIASGDVSLQSHARVQRNLLHLFTEATVDVDQLASEAMDAIRVFERLGDELGLARAWRLLQQARYLGRQSAASADAAEHGLRHARKAGDALEEVEIIDWLGVALFMGGTPASEAERRVEAHLEDLRPGHASESVLLSCRAGLKAMQGQLVEARALIDRARQRPLVDEPAYMPRQYVVSFHLGWTELLAGNPTGAESTLRAALEPLEAIGETSGYSAIVALLAEAVYRQGRYGEAEQWTRTSENAAHLNDVFANITWRRVRAKALARQGELGEAERIAAETLSFCAESDFLNAHGEALLDFAEVLELSGRRAEACAAADEAIGLFDRKENVILAARARTLLEELRSGA